MPTLYFASPSSAPVKRAALTFRELRGMFGAYDTHYSPPDWSQACPGAPCKGCVIAEVTTRDGTTQAFPQPGLYRLLGLSTARVDEILKYRGSHSQRAEEAEQWGLDGRPALAGPMDAKHRPRKR